MSCVRPGPKNAVPRRGAVFSRSKSRSAPERGRERLRQRRSPVSARPAGSASFQETLGVNTPGRGMVNRTQSSRPLADHPAQVSTPRNGASRRRRSSLHPLTPVDSRLPQLTRIIDYEQRTQFLRPFRGGLAAPLPIPRNATSRGVRPALHRLTPVDARLHRLTRAIESAQRTQFSRPRAAGNGGHRNQQI